MEQILEKLGFSKNESKVYIALINLGPSSAVKLSNEIKVHRTNVYETLERLIKKGFVKYVMIGKTKIFEAAPPERIMDDIRNKEKSFKDILPQLSAKYHDTENKTIAHIYRNISSLKTILTRFLKSKQPILVFGVPKEATDLLGPWINHFHKDRINAGVEMLHLYNERAMKRIKILNRMKHTEARSLPTEFDSPVSTQVCGNEVAIIHWQKNPLIIFIEDKNVADSYKEHFNFLWKLARKHKKKSQQ